MQVSFKYFLIEFEFLFPESKYPLVDFCCTKAVQTNVYIVFSEPVKFFNIFIFKLLQLKKIFVLVFQMNQQLIVVHCKKKVAFKDVRVITNEAHYFVVEYEIMFQILDGLIGNHVPVKFKHFYDKIIE